VGFLKNRTTATWPSSDNIVQGPGRAAYIQSIWSNTIDAIATIRQEFLLILLGPLAIGILNITFDIHCSSCPNARARRVGTGIFRITTPARCQVADMNTVGLLTHSGLVFPGVDSPRHAMCRTSMASPVVLGEKRNQFMGSLPSRCRRLHFQIVDADGRQ
jgi:hypothetical protein